MVNLSNTRLYQHDRGFYFLEKSLPVHHGLPRRGDSNTHHNICFYGEISKINNLYHFHLNPRLPLFLLYVRWKSEVTFVWRCFCDVCPHQVVEKCFLEIDYYVRYIFFFRNLPFKHFCLSSFFSREYNYIYSRKNVPHG